MGPCRHVILPHQSTMRSKSNRFVRSLKTGLQCTICAYCRLRQSVHGSQERAAGGAVPAAGGGACVQRDRPAGGTQGPFPRHQHPCQRLHPAVKPGALLYMLMVCIGAPQLVYSARFSCFSKDCMRVCESAGAQAAHGSTRRAFRELLPPRPGDAHHLQ